MKKTIVLTLLIIGICSGTVLSQTRRKPAARRKAPAAKSARPTAPKPAATKTAQTPNAAATAAVTTASGLTYIITERKPDGRQLQAGDNVIVHYTGLLTNGVKFDSSLDRGEPFSFPLGGRRVIKGWDEGVQKLRVGERATLIIPPEIGYGARGAGDVIPPNATLIFIIEVVGVR